MSKLRNESNFNSCGNLRTWHGYSVTSLTFDLTSRTTHPERSYLRSTLLLFDESVNINALCSESTSINVNVVWSSVDSIGSISIRYHELKNATRVHPRLPPMMAPPIAKTGCKLNEGYILNAVRPLLAWKVILPSLALYIDLHCMYTFTPSPSECGCLYWWRITVIN